VQSEIGAHVGVGRSGVVKDKRKGTVCRADPHPPVPIRDRTVVNRKAARDPRRTKREMLVLY